MCLTADHGITYTGESAVVPTAESWILESGEPDEQEEQPAAEQE